MCKESEHESLISVTDAAAYLITEYERVYGSPIEETKLHCMLYFAQCISYTIYDRPLFPEPFIGRSDGPFSQEAHDLYESVYNSET